MALAKRPLPLGPGGDPLLPARAQRRLLDDPHRALAGLLVGRAGVDAQPRHRALSQHRPQILRAVRPALAVDLGHDLAGLGHESDEHVDLPLQNLDSDHPVARRRQRNLDEVAHPHGELAGDRSRREDTILDREAVPTYMDGLFDRGRGRGTTGRHQPGQHHQRCERVTSHLSQWNVSTVVYRAKNALRAMSLREFDFPRRVGHHPLDER